MFFFFKITENSEVKEDAGRTCHAFNTVNNSARRFWHEILFKKPNKMFHDYFRQLTALASGERSKPVTKI